jgi:predicted ATPase/DNA-binding SARP family transcriptional activator
MTILETSDVPLSIMLFGPMQVQLDGQPIPHLSRSARWLLALLTLHHGRPVAREWLAGALWPDMEQSQAFANFRPVLSELRSSLGHQKARLQSPSRLTLLLELTGAQVDLLAFDAAIKSKQLPSLEQAVELYRGPLLEGCNEEWMYQDRTVREQNCLQALQTLADSALTAENFHTAIGYYQRAISIDPFWDSARRGWMEALAKSGNRNAALQVYREFMDLLRNDPTATPDEQTTALYKRLRAGARKPSNAQAVATVSATRPPRGIGFLPHPLTDLVGRVDERLEVMTWLRRSRLVTLTGPGGIGKTRLAIQIAKESVREYADGVWLVTLEAIFDDTRIVSQIASVLGLREEPGRPLLESLTDHLRTKRLLLVLDNCEHLREASAQVCAHLLWESAQVRILATSREALGITGETVLQVPALPTPDPAHLPPEKATLLRVLMSYESAELFVERAQAVQNGFAPTGSNAMAVAQVCSQLEGIPLAIELAAARVRTLTVEQIAVRLDDHLSLLTIGNRAAQSRQQTLRATLDWSYALLSQAERLLLGRVSVFSGGWTLEAAESVCADAEPESNEIQNPKSKIQNQEVPELLTCLVDKSLVVFEERGRYRLLETVRQYAVEHLQTGGEAELVQPRHWNWCVALAEEAETHWWGAAQEAWLHRLDTEYANLRAALMWSGTDIQEAQVQLRLAGALWRYWNARGYYSEGRQFLEKALTGEEVPGATLARAKALQGAGALALMQNDHVLAQTLLEESLSICREFGDKLGIALATGYLGDIAHNRGDLATAQTQFEESLRLHRELKNKNGSANMLIKLGEMAYNHGDTVMARTQLEESLLLYRESGNKFGMSNALSVLGNAASNRGDYGSARTQLEESLLLRWELGNKQGIAAVLNNLAKASALQGDFEAARTQFEESLLLCREMGIKMGIAIATGNLGTVVANHQGDYVMARTQLEESLLLYRELGYTQGLAYALLSLGDVVSRQGDYAAARTQLAEGLHLCQELGDKQGIAYALCYLGRVVARQGDTVMARTQLAEGLLLCRELGDKRGIALALENMAGALSAETESVQAARLLGAAQALRKNIHAPLPRGEQEPVDRQIARVRTVLGTTAFTLAWEEGSAMTLEQAVGYALKE